MKKSLINFILLLSIVLTACGSGNAATEEVETQVPATEAAEATEETDTSAPQSSVATCTAQSEPIVDLMQEGDWVTGATEEYSVTLIEYGDFQ